MQVTKMGNIQWQLLTIIVSLLSLVPHAHAEQKTGVLRTAYAESPLSAGLDIQYSSVRYSKYLLDSNVVAPRESHMIRIGMEWIPIVSKYGKVGSGFGFGVGYAPNLPLDDGRYATLKTFPLDFSLSFRGDIQKNQIIVPFLKSGVGVTLAKQDSISGAAKPDTQKFFGFVYGGGLEFGLNRLDLNSSKALDASMGINSTFLIIDYSRSLPIGSYTDGDLSHEGFSLGLRFEM